MAERLYFVRSLKLPQAGIRRRATRSDTRWPILLAHIKAFSTFEYFINIFGRLFFFMNSTLLFCSTLFLCITNECAQSYYIRAKSYVIETSLYTHTLFSLSRTQAFCMTDDSVCHNTSVCNTEEPVYVFTANRIRLYYREVGVCIRKLQ